MPLRRETMGSMTLAALVLLSFLAAVPQEDGDCVRGEPEPLYSRKSPGVQAHSFKRRSLHEAEEVVVFKTGDKLRIRNWGCEYFVTTFRYESKGIQGAKSEMLYWFMKSAEILRVLAQSKPNVPFDLEKAARTLEASTKGDEELSFDHSPFPVQGDGTEFLQTQVVVKAGGKLNIRPGGYIEVELMKGPL